MSDVIQAHLGSTSGFSVVLAISDWGICHEHSFLLHHDNLI